MRKPILDETSPSKRRPAFHTPGHIERSRQELAYDDYVADHPGTYDTCKTVRYRKQVGRRHMRRRMRRATRQAQRRAAR